MKLKAETYRPMEIGDYLARFTGYEEDDGEHGPFVKWYFEVLDEEYEGRSLKGITSTSFNPMSKMWAWVQALLGTPIEDGEEIDLDDLIGRECMLDITHHKTERGTFERIVGVRPVKQRRVSKREEEHSNKMMKEETKREKGEVFDNLPSS